MASAEEYVSTRNRAQSLVEAIEDHTGLRVYFNGRDIPTAEDFNSSDSTRRVHREALQNSTCFVLYLPDRVSRPSTVWVEAGMALAWGLSSVYFIPHLESLPYLLQRAALPSDQGGSELVTAHYIDGKPEEPHRLVRLHGRKLFANHGPNDVRPSPAAASAGATDQAHTASSPAAAPAAASSRVRADATR